MTTYAFDPEIAAALRQIPDLPGDDPLAIRASVSEMIAQLPAPDTTGVQIEDRHIPGRDGDPAVPIRIYRPEQRSVPAAVYSIHGGGFIAGARLPDSVVDEMVDLFHAAPEDLGTSILADRESNRGMEWDLRNGVIIRKGRAHHLDTRAGAAAGRG